MEQQQEMVMALTARHIGVEQVKDNLEPLPRVGRRL
jgi:hypothetical protein